MHLQEKLTSTSKDEAAREISKLLRDTRVGVTWKGNRIVEVKGYEGSVKIRELASKFLTSSVFAEEAHPTLQERYDAFRSWEKIQKLYVDSDALLQKAAPLSKCLAAWEEYADSFRSIIDAEEGMKEHPTKGALFEFTLDEFKDLWPGAQPQGYSWRGLRKPPERYAASLQMVKSALSLDD